MVLVSHKHNFIFLKTRKTAGTTVEMALEPLCRPVGAIVTERTPALVTQTGIVGRRLTPATFWTRHSWKTDWYNHMPARKIRKALGPKNWAGYRKIATVRNPFDMAVSHFHWELSRRNILESNDFFETRARFHEMIIGSTFNCSYHAVHIDGIFVPDDVVRFETLTADVTALYQRYVPEHEVILPHTKNTGTRRRRPVQDYFDAETIAAIRKNSAWVFDRFGYAETPPERPATTLEAP